MVDWFWIYNPHFKFLVGYAKPKEASDKWAIHLIRKQDGLACGSNRDMLFNLNGGFVLELQKTFYVPSFSRNLISVSRLVPFGYSFHFLETSFSLIYKFDCVGNGILSDGLYCIFLQNDTTYNSLHVQTGIKRCVVNEDSSTLWH